MKVPCAVLLSFAIGYSLGQAAAPLSTSDFHDSGSVMVGGEILTNVTAIAAGSDHNLALKADGTVAAWGSNVSGQCLVPSGLRSVIAVAAGDNFSLALKTDGTITGWGNNADGEATGVPTRKAPFVASGPVTVAGQTLSYVIAIAAGNSYSLAVKRDGTAVAWGAAGAGIEASNLIAVAADPAGRGDLGLRKDGTIIKLQGHQEQLPISYAGLSSVVAIAVGGHHCVALRNDGTVVAWGLNTYGQTNVPAGLAHVAAISAGADYSLALKSDGTVVGWGSYHPEDLPPRLTNVIAIAGGWNHSLALRKDGTVVEWKGRRGGLRLSGSSARGSQQNKPDFERHRPYAFFPWSDGSMGRLNLTRQP